MVAFERRSIANVQKQLVAAGKINMVGDREFYHTAAELTRIMGHKNADAFFNDPTAVNPQTGQLLNPPPAPPPLDPNEAGGFREKAKGIYLAPCRRLRSTNWNEFSRSL